MTAISLQINIGILHIVGGVLKRQRGLTIALSVMAADNAETVTTAAVRKQQAYGHITQGRFLLVYPTMYEEVKTFQDNLTHLLQWRGTRRTEACSTREYCSSSALQTSMHNIGVRAENVVIVE